MSRGESLRSFSERMGLGYLLEEWDRERNDPLTPDTVYACSKKKVWWRCAKGHEWASAVDTRSSGSGCPYCAGKRPVVGENDLAAKLPELARQWHPEKNGVLRPEDFTCGSNRKVWWRCEKGHEWQATIYARSIGGNCPYCSGRKVKAGENDFATWYPELAKQWSAQNGSLKPEKLRPFSNRKVWWECEAGHQWQATVNSRISHNSGCPYCSNRKVQPGFNDLATLHPKIAAQWHPSLNGMLRPEQVVAGSHKNVWWRCEEGHVWRAMISSRTGKRKHGCPLCAGNVSKERRARYERELAAILPQDGD